MQAANAAPSSEHWNVEPCSSAEKLNVALVLLVSAAGAPEPIEVCGAVVSGGCWTVQLKLAGVASTLPSASIALTRKVCPPTLRPLYSIGVSHSANAAPSREHSKVGSTSLAWKVNEALVAGLEASGVAGDRRLGRHRHGPLVQVRRLVDRSELVPRGDLEGVVAVEEPGVRLRRGAEGGLEPVERAEVVHAVLVGVERERRARGRARCAGPESIVVSGAGTIVQL